MHNLALTYQAQGRNADAAKIQEEVLEKSRGILGEEHPDTLSTLHNLASTYQAQGRNADAAKIQEDIGGEACPKCQTSCIIKIYIFLCHAVLFLNIYVLSPTLIFLLGPPKLKTKSTWGPISTLVGQPSSVKILSSVQSYSLWR